MAECHPVGFQWVMEAKARGATVIHVDPRFTRTSAVADLHVPLRAGVDIAFLGGLINYVLSSGKYFRDYVVDYTNAATIIGEEFRDTEDLDGLFSGFDPESAPTTRQLDVRGHRGAGRLRRAGRGVRRPDAGSVVSGAQAARGEAHGSGGAHVGTPQTDPTLQHPRCVFQILKRHFARYTPEMVEQACGIPQASFRPDLRGVTANSGRDRTTAFVYSVGWTQHTVGVQYIRAASILQTLLGNIGRPGGGILALRGHASHPGLHRHPDAVRPAARLHPDAARAHERGPRRVHRRGGHRQGLLGEHARLHGQPAQGLVGRRRDRGERLLLRLPAAADRQPLAPTRR